MCCQREAPVVAWRWCLSTSGLASNSGYLILSLLVGSSCLSTVIDLGQPEPHRCEVEGAKSRLVPQALPGLWKDCGVLHPSVSTPAEHLGHCACLFVWVLCYLQVDRGCLWRLLPWCPPGKLVPPPFLSHSPAGMELVIPPE